MSCNKVQRNAVLDILQKGSKVTNYSNPQVASSAFRLRRYSSPEAALPGRTNLLQPQAPHLGPWWHELRAQIPSHHAMSTSGCRPGGGKAPSGLVPAGDG